MVVIKVVAVADEGRKDERVWTWITANRAASKLASQARAAHQPHRDMQVHKDLARRYTRAM